MYRVSLKHAWSNIDGSKLPPALLYNQVDIIDKGIVPIVIAIGYNSACGFPPSRIRQKSGPVCQKPHSKPTMRAAVSAL